MHTLHVVREELALHASFFVRVPAGTAAENVGGGTALWHVWYDRLRPLVLQQTELDVLCEMAHILRVEVLGATQTDHDGASFDPIVARLLQDVQERIAFRVQAFVHDGIRSFRPATADVELPDEPTDRGDCWFPPLSRALACLAKVYPCVPRPVFQGLAQEVVSECMASVLRASARLRADGRAVDAALLEISQLLALREQIAPFSLDFAVTHKALDFTATRNVLRQLASRQRLGGVAAVLDLLQRGAPSLVESQEDAKVQIERQLRVSCDTFVLHCTAVSIGQLTEVLAAQAPATAAICSALDATERAVRETLSPLRTRMAMYLPEPATLAILIGPIKHNVLEAFGQLQTRVGALQARPGAVGRFGWGRDSLNPPELAVKGRERSADALFARLPQLTDRERESLRIDRLDALLDVLAPPG